MCKIKIHFASILLSLLPLLFDGFVFAQSSKNGDNLILVHTLCRHGNRNILKSYANDPWKSKKYWKGGYGQLTDVGIQQLYELGQYLRKRYQKLLVNGEYSPNKVYVQSSNTTRTILSAEACLAGLFPIGGNQYQNASQNWQTIPLHIVPRNEDYTLLFEKPCNRYEKLLVEQINPKIYNGLFVKYKSLIQYLTKNSGVNIKTLTDINALYDTLFVEKSAGFELPPWAKKVMNAGGDFEKLALSWFVINTTTTETMKLSSGFLLKEILDRCTNKIKSLLSPDRSLWMYFGHDLTLIYLLNTLKLYTLHRIPYAACIFIELYESVDGPYVQVIYKSSKRHNTDPLEIPNCGSKCPLDKFYELYGDILPTKSFDEECMLHDGGDTVTHKNPRNKY